MMRQIIKKKWTTPQHHPNKKQQQQTTTTTIDALNAYVTVLYCRKVGLNEECIILTGKRLI